MDRFMRDSYIQKTFQDQLEAKVMLSDVAETVSDIDRAVAEICDKLTFLTGFVMGAQSAQSAQQPPQEPQSQRE